MKVIKLNLKGDYAKVIDEALKVLSQGGTIVYPTDTIYGIGTNACVFKAVEQVFKIKDRPLNKPIPIIARNLNWVRELAFLPPKLEELLKQIWPGPVTAVLPKRSVLPSILTGNLPSVGIRVPDFAFTEQLMAKFGYPLTTTSANLSGEEGIPSAKQIYDIFKDRLWKPDLIIDAGVLPESVPSTILDLTSIKPKILRVGPTNPALLMKLLGATYENTKTNPKRGQETKKSN